MFDIQFVPGEAQNSVDWVKLQSDLSPVQDEPHGTPVSMAGTPLYPIFEVAVWELTAMQQLLVALDERFIALEQSLVADGVAGEVAKSELRKAENDLKSARTEFLEAFHRLERRHGMELPLQNGRIDGMDDAGEKRILEALNALWDMEAVWSSHRVLRPEQKFRTPEKSIATNFKG
jgi:hypothetical protein